MLIRDISAKLRVSGGFCEEVEEALFTQIVCLRKRFRAAIRFHNRVVVLLQRLEEGQGVRVAARDDLSTAKEKPDGMDFQRPNGVGPALTKKSGKAASG